MLTSILGARLSWYQADGWVFDPVIVGPDIIEYTLAKGPHAGRHAIQHFYYQRVAPGVETRSGTRRAARSSISRGTWRHRRRTASLLFLPGWPKI